MNVVQQPGPDLFYGTVPGPRAQMVRLFFLSSPIFGRKILLNPQSARGPARCKSGPEITWLVGITIYCTIFQQQFSNSSPPPQLSRSKNLKKN